MKVFISYSSKNRDYVKALAADLETAVRAISPSTQYKVWFDQEITGGHDWWNAILGALQDCDLFVFALSPQSLESDACDREWRYAFSLNKRILPVWVAGDLVPADLDPRLQRKQIVDYRTQDKAAFQKLLDALKTLEPPSPLPVPLPVAPEAPMPPLSGIRQQLQAERLDMDTQWSLVGKLKHYLTKPDEAQDAYRHMLTLKQHPTALAQIAQEIDRTLEDLPPEIKLKLGISTTSTPPLPKSGGSSTGPATVIEPRQVVPPSSTTQAQVSQQPIPARRGAGCNLKLIGVVLGVLIGYAFANSAQSCYDFYNCENYFSLPLFIMTFIFFAGAGFIADWLAGLFRRRGN
ncbi:MAG: TIR domain-containing protein [Anaerolineae bacterium]|nr:TIR domain-containing protein [Anaerolineae bacterium]